MIKVDFIIIGQGIAGTVLSHQLIEKGFSVRVFDKVKSNSASRIAAGVFNPVAYRKLKVAEFADFLLPEMKTYFNKLQEELQIPFFKPLSFLKLLTDFEEYNNWQNQCALEANQPYMSPEIFKSNFKNGIKNPFGAGQVLQSGVLNLPLLLDTWKKKLIEKGSYSSEIFDYESLKITPNGISYNSISASKIIFSEGVGVLNNPWFKWLPIQQFKGEVLEILAPTLDVNRLINRGVFVLPLGNGIFKVGATHDWRHIDETPTKEGKQELIEKLDKIINVPYKVTKHIAGFRPSARDRRPYIGVHPYHSNLFVFNGLGSKGVIMVPWLVKQFIGGLENSKWPKEFDIKRYIRFYNDWKKENEKN